MFQLAAWCQRFLPARWWVAALCQRNRVLAPFYPEPFRSVLPFTMMAPSRLRALHRLAERLDHQGVSGDIVECGTCRGGSGALLAHAASRSPQARRVWLLDSFAGLPEAGSEDGPDAKHYQGACRGSVEAVTTVLRHVGVAESQVRIVPGWLKDTLPGLAVERIALLHIDVDFYDPVLLTLRHLYDRLAVGGVVVLDDYGTWPGCRQAVTDFQRERRLSLAIHPIDGHAVYLRKEGCN